MRYETIWGENTTTECAIEARNIGAYTAREIDHCGEALDGFAAGNLCC